MGVAEAEEVRQRIGVAHIAFRLFVHEIEPVAVVDIPLEFVGVDLRVMPRGRAAGLYDETHAGVCAGFDHLLHVVACKAVLTFQIRPAEVDKDRPAAVIGEGRGAKRHAHQDREQNCNGFFQQKRLL